MGTDNVYNELRVSFQKRLIFIRSMQMQNKAPSDSQLAQFLQSVHTESKSIADKLGSQAEQDELNAQLDKHLQGQVPFDQADDALESLVLYYRQREIDYAMRNTEPSARELDSLSLAVSRLWDLDINRLEPNMDYALDLQGGKKFHEQGKDTASRPLFKFVAKSLWNPSVRPTYAAFQKLLDNYEMQTGVEESASKEEKQEMTQFLDVVCKTPVMKYVLDYLSTRDLINAEEGKNNMETFKKYLYKLWFYFYRREGQNDSSAFEHVFVGEVRDNEVIGFHNWIRILLEEKAGNLNYTGYIAPRHGSSRQAPDSDEHLLAIQFDWKGFTKPMCSCFMGVSPEFELAVYTLIFLATKDDDREQDIIAKVEDDVEVKIVVHKMGKHNPRIGSSYPQLMD